MSGPDRLRLVVRDAEGHARLTREVVTGVVAALDSAEPSGVVTLEGTDGAFCQGLHLDAIAPLLDGAPAEILATVLDGYSALLTAVSRCPRPVLALVDGPALGGGLGLAAASDVVLATRRAVFALPEALIGLLPVFAFVAVASRTGIARARLLAMGGPTLDAEAACRMGLVDEVVDDLEAAASRYAARLGRMDPRSIAAVKRAVADHVSCGAGYAAAARLEALRLGASRATVERLNRFLAGEPPWAPSAS